MNDLDVADYLDRVADELPTAPHRTLEAVQRRAATRHRRRTVGGVVASLGMLAAVGGLVLNNDLGGDLVAPTAPVITSETPFGPVKAVATLCTAEYNCGDQPEATVVDALDAVSTDDAEVRVVRVIGSQIGRATPRPQETRVVLELGATRDPTRLVDRIVAIDGVATLVLGTSEVVPNAWNGGDTDATVVESHTLTLPVHGAAGNARQTAPLEWYWRSDGQVCVKYPQSSSCSWPTFSDDIHLATRMTSTSYGESGELCTQIVMGTDVTEVRPVDDDGNVPAVTSVPLSPHLSRLSLHLACWSRGFFEVSALEIETPDGNVTTFPFELPRERTRRGG